MFFGQLHGRRRLARIQSLHYVPKGALEPGLLLYR